MVLRGWQQGVALAVAEGNHRHFRAFQSLFDQESFGCGAQSSEGPNRLHRFLAVGGDDHALPCGQAVRFDHRGAPPSHKSLCFVRRFKNRRLWGRHPRSGHHLLGKGFGAFQSRCCRTRPKHGNPCPAQGVGDSLHQWRLRTHHHQIDPIVSNPPEQCLVIVQVQRDVAGEPRRTRVSRSAKQVGEPSAPGDFPGERMFPAPGTKNQYPHASLPGGLNGENAGRR